MKGLEQAWQGWAHVTRHRPHLCLRPTSPGSPEAIPPPRNASLPRIYGAYGAQGETESAVRLYNFFKEKCIMLRLAGRCGKAVNLFMGSCENCEAAGFLTAPEPAVNTVCACAERPFPCPGALALRSVKSRTRVFALSFSRCGQGRAMDILCLLHNSRHGLFFLSLSPSKKIKCLLTLVNKNPKNPRDQSEPVFPLALSS